MAIVVTIGGVVKSIKIGTLDISETLNGNNRLTVQLDSMDGSYRPARGASIVVTENGTRIFGGVIAAPQEAGFGGIGLAPITNTIDASDYNIYTTWRYVNLSIPAGTLKAAMTALLPYFPASVTIPVGQVDGPALPVLTYSWVLLADVLNDIVTRLGQWAWNIDYTEQFTFTSTLTASAPAAPFNIVNADGHILGDAAVNTSTDEYKNRVIAVYNSQGLSAWALLKATSNFTDGESVTVGSIAYLMQTTLTNIAGHVKIGATTAISLSNLMNAINQGPGFGTVYAAATPANTLVTASIYDTGVLKASAKTAGTGGNTIGCTDSAANASWVWAADAATTHLDGGADTTATNFVMSDNLGEQAAQGIQEIIIDASDTADPVAAQTKADTELARRVPCPQQVLYATRDVGLHPGQVQHITIAWRNVNDNFLITEVKIRNDAANSMLRQVTAMQNIGPYQGSWRDLYTQWSGGTATSGTSGSGTGGTSAVTLHAHMGGSRSQYLEPAAGYVVIPEYVVLLAHVTTSYTIRVEMHTTNAATSVSARVWDITAAAEVTGSVLGPCTATTPTEFSAIVTLTGGHRYRVELTRGNTSNGVYVDYATLEL